MFRTPFDCLKRTSSMPISSLKQFHWLIKIHTLATFQKKIQIKIYQTISKTRVTEIIIAIPLTL